MDLMIPSGGPVDARYLAFLETLPQLRPRLHRYCARMTGSVLDGEDVVQESLFLAYRKLDSFDGARPLGPWLFRIAHNQCIDFLRRRGVRMEVEGEAAEPDVTPPPDLLATLDLTRAVERLVIHLPPKERACVLLKDVLDHSLEDIAELVDTSVGGVKAALHRGRAKLTQLAAEPPAEAAVPGPPPPRIFHQYVEHFNRRDWDGLRELIRADARLRVADRYMGTLADSPYFSRYEQAAAPWRMELGELDGEPVIVAMTAQGRRYVRLEIAAGVIVAIADYSHCAWIADVSSAVAEPYLQQ